MARSSLAGAGAAVLHHRRRRLRASPLFLVPFVERMAKASFAGSNPMSWRVFERFLDWGYAVLITVVCLGLGGGALAWLAMDWRSTFTTPLADSVPVRGSVERLRVKDRGRGPSYLLVMLRPAQGVASTVAARVLHEEPAALADEVRVASDDISVWLPRDAEALRDPFAESDAIQLAAGDRVLVGRDAIARRRERERGLLWWVSVVVVLIAGASVVPVVQTWRATLRR